jgi:hypothetical protein
MTAKLQILEIGSGPKKQESSENRILYRNSGMVPLKIPEYWGILWRDVVRAEVKRLFTRKNNGVPLVLRKVVQGFLSRNSA